MSNPIENKSLISLPEGFVFGQVEPQPAASVNRAAAFSLAPLEITPPLGPLGHFTGQWVGTGFNTIFRPDNSVTPTKFANPIAPGSPRDNVLELNLTQESLTFSPALGSVPNRGSGAQGDIQLNGIPYLQAINDVTVAGTSVGIHVEPGLWMSVPSSTTPALAATVTRMASIPHGTTINAQGIATVSVPGKPAIPSVNITPSLIGGGSITFASQTATNANTPRIPQDLSTFIAHGTITQAMLTDPNTLLRSHLSALTVLNTTTISVSTAPAPPLSSGGTDNIAFLASPPAPNANAVQMSATFWVETIQYTLTLPVHPLGAPPLLIKGQGSVPGQAVPTFQVTPVGAVVRPTEVTVTSTQIQYSQTVILNFNGLSWPHVSVATLVPANPIPVSPVVPGAPIPRPIPL